MNRYIISFDKKIKRTDAWCQISKCFALSLRIRTHESRNELKPVWDFILIENLTSVPCQLFTCVHIIVSNDETQTGIDFISVILTETKFQTVMRFSCEQNLHKTKWISAVSLDIAFNAHVRLELIAGIEFISVIFTEMKFHYG